MNTNRRIALLSAYLATVYTGAVVTYSITENSDLWDSAWWGMMTLTTVGYGDQYPHTTVGRIMGILLVTSAVFIIIPTLTAFIATRLIVNDDAWTHDEQEQVKDDLKQILTTLKTNVTYTTNKSIHKG